MTYRGIFTGLTFTCMALPLFTRAQDTTPVRSFGSASPGMELSVPMDSTGLMTTQPGPATTTTTTVTRGVDEGPPVPWWEGAEAVAIESMNQQPFSFGVSMLAGYEYDDQVFLSDVIEGTAHSYFFRLPISVEYEGGAVSITAAYSPEYRFYDGAGLDDAFSQALSFGAAWKGARSSVGLDVNLAQTDGANVEAGDRVDAVTIFTTLRGAYEVSTKTTVGASLAYNPMEYDTFASYVRYNASAYVDYAVTPKTTLGVGAGYEIVDSEADVSSEAWSVVGRVNWKATEKLAARGNAGFEVREFDSGESIEAPIFSLGASYQAGVNTLITLDGYSRSTPSISEAGQVYYSTGVLAGVEQKILSRLGLRVSLGFENSEYEAVSEDVEASREDNYAFGRVQLSYAIREKYQFSVYYQHSTNDSDGSSVSFDRNLIGTTFSIAF